MSVMPQDVSLQDTLTEEAAMPPLIEENLTIADASTGAVTSACASLNGAEPDRDTQQDMRDGGDSKNHRQPKTGPERTQAERTQAMVKPPFTTSPTALQDMFLNGLRRENIDVVVYFCDGSQERGVVRAIDTFTLLLENRGSGKAQLVYKHSIARIFPVRAPSLPLDRSPKSRNSQNHKHS